MTIRMVCSECGSTLKVKDELAGSLRHCPKCRTELLIPSADDHPPASDMELEALSHDSAETLQAATQAEAADVETSVGSDRLAGLKAVSAPADHETAELQASGDTQEVATTSTGAIPEDEPEATPVAPPPRKRTKAPAVRNEDEDFDPVAFLTETDDRPAPEKRPETVARRREPLERPRRDLSPREVSPVLPEPTSFEETPSRQPAAPTAASSAASVSGASAAADLWDHAKAVKQLRKAMKEGSAELKQHHTDREPAVDWAGMAREIGMRGVGVLAIGLVIALGGYYGMNSMMGGGIKLPKLGYVEGVVTLDGQPVVGATVFYSPLESELGAGGRDRIRTSTAVTDDSGHYRMLYIDRTAGVAVGRSRVWVSSVGAPTPIDIPPDFGDGSMILKEVAEGRQKIDIEMSSKPAQTAARG